MTAEAPAAAPRAGPENRRWRPTALERAFELAKSGRFATVTEIRSCLVAERYDAVSSQISGKSLVRQLDRLIASAKAEPVPAL